MNIVIINCFETYEDRVELLERFFIRRGNQVKIITSNFRHFQKTFREETGENRIFIKTRPYYKNMSLKRMFSHWCFSCSAEEEVSKHNPDLIYVLIPPNSLVKRIAGVKKRNPNIKIIFDVIDLWPETMPIPFVKEFFLFKMWKKLRNDYLKYADYVITECDLYQQRLKEYLKETRYKTVRLASEKKCMDIQDNTSNEKIALCYLGSINNIIDIDIVGEIIEKIAMQTKVELHIIGGGETKEALINIARKKGAEVFDYGSVYEALEKQRIFNKCDYGLNILKESVCVGLTMKSIDYFGGGLPIINNIPGDTWALVEKHQVGVNYEKGQELQLKHIEKAHVSAFFEERFADKVFEKNMQAVYDEILG